jgi:hypothetical protein
MEYLDLLQTPAADLRPASVDALEVDFDLGDPAVCSRTCDSFDDLVAREQYRNGSLERLQKCRLVLRDGGRLVIRSARPDATRDGYLESQEMLLRIAGFTDVVVKSIGPPTVVQAAKRPPVVEEYDHGIVLREIIDPAEVLACHQFARDYYYYKDFNYDLEVVRQFDLNADLYAVYDASHKIAAIGRGVVRVPGYNCPFMHAVTDDGTHYEVPARFRRICEVMGLFKEGRGGVVAFKNLMEFLTQYAYYIAGVDSIWTTYDGNDPFTGNYYKSKLLMQESGVRLTYRDFGGKWNLIWTDRIVELRDLHRGMFKR